MNDQGTSQEKEAEAADEEETFRFHAHLPAMVLSYVLPFFFFGHSIKDLIIVF